MMVLYLVSLLVSHLVLELVILLVSGLVVLWLEHLLADLDPKL